ncbi:hypothetical protein DFH09DRAFT_1148558 [Mycena vulgaris]|nr:hypothetical protein DFH09DRAFT_1148558 [Mycena vulgaris]
MSRHAAGAFFRRVNHVGPSTVNLCPRCVVFPVWRTRRYTVESTSSPRLTPKLAALLPAPEASTAPLIESDFSEYIVPLYDLGWSFEIAALDRMKPEGTTLLRRTFQFPSTKELAAFTANTQNAPFGGITVLRNLWADVDLSASEGVTRKVIRLALETEMEYQKIVGNNFPPPSMKLRHKMTTLEQAQALVVEKPGKARTLALAPVTHVALPPVPPAPAFPPFSLGQEDLETYIKPLVTNGWRLGGIRPMRRFKAARNALRNSPCLHRLYRITDYAAARRFLHAIVAEIPAQPPGSLAGVEVQLASDPSSLFTLEVWSLSKLADSDPTPGGYGISHADVRFAITIEDAFAEGWASGAEHVARARKIPTLNQLWGLDLDVKPEVQTAARKIKPRRRFGLNSDGVY